MLLSVPCFLKEQKKYITAKDLKRYEEAKNSLETALEINPDYEPAIKSLEELMLEIQE